MRMEWLQKRDGAREVLVIFSGWGIGPTAFIHLTTDADILCLSDYRDLATNLPDLSIYETRNLIAWSFGVASYALWQENRANPFDRRVALCGSMTPVDRDLGIPPVAMQKTIDTLSDSSFLIFLRRCYGRAVSPEPVDISALKEELLAVQARDYSQVQHVWDKAVISRTDKIFPAKNLRAAWDGKATSVTETDAPHVPFSAWSTWAEVLK